MKIIRVTIWPLVVLLAAIPFFLLRFLEEEELFTRGAVDLLLGNIKEATLRYSGLVESLRFGERARLGYAICRAHHAGISEDELAALPEVLDVVAFALPTLMMREFIAGDFEGCLRLAELAERAGVPSASLLKAAILLENGNIAEAEALWIGVPGRFKATVIGQRFSSALELLSRPVKSVVRDRGGELAGVIDSAGEFHFAEGIDPALIPRAAVKELTEASPEKSIRLSTDLELSRLVKSALEGYRGSIVLLEPQTGDVLAAVSDDRTLTGGGDPAFEQRLEPASIAKIITLSAALRAGIDADPEIKKITCEGAIRYEGGILYCPYTAGKLRGLRHAMAISCNIAFAELGVMVGWVGMLEEHRRYGFDGNFGNPFAVGKILIESGTERSLADLSIGLEAVDITPLHAAMIAALLANGGRMLPPRLIAADDGVLGMSPGFHEVGEGRMVLEESLLPAVLDSLAGVSMGGGTAAWIAPVDFPVAMKTGTGSSWRQGFHVNYIGVGPMPKPAIEFCVRVTNERTSPRARKAGFEVTRRLLYGLSGIALRRGWKSGSHKLISDE